MRPECTSDTNVRAGGMISADEIGVAHSGEVIAYLGRIRLQAQLGFSCGRFAVTIRNPAAKLRPAS